ncbi:MAG: NAD(P)H-dependent glycerol-3-phosphate dehydrogenase [Fimbriimonadaceae bacterium]
MHVNVIGAGSWGTSIALLLGRNGHDVTLYGLPDENLFSTISLRENMQYLPGFVLPETVTITADEESLPEADFWVIAVPSQAVKGVSQMIAGRQAQAVALIASKGLALGAELLGDVVAQFLPQENVGALSGPNLAIEIARGIPTASVCAYQNEDTANFVRGAFMCGSFRVYTSTDLIGVELAGALKNVMAIAAGISDGLGFGDNTKGALLARGLNEMSKLGVALGGRLETFMGIAGVGDLFATAASKLSRNYRVGYALGQGRALKDALEEIGQVAEGVPTSEAALILARRHQMVLPTFEAVDNTLKSRIRPSEAVALLMERSPKSES